MALFVGRIPREMNNVSLFGCIRVTRCLTLLRCDQRDLEDAFSKYGKITRLDVKTGNILSLLLFMAHCTYLHFIQALVL